jgi:uncharacterized protein YdcH (DUF465 family)
MDKSDSIRTVLLIESIFPEYRNEITRLFEEDEIFREIVREYVECKYSMEKEEPKNGRICQNYQETLSELKEELREYLEKIRPE